MLNSKSFLAVDFGAGSLKLAEFEQNEAGGLRLKQYGIKSLGIEGSQEAARESAILKALQEALAERHYGSKQINVCAPGFHVFSKFVKLPPVDTSKVTQIIRYEAQQNVPFPLEEVVWDYQILGASATSELEVLLVAVKTEVVEGLFRVAEGAGLRLKLVDVSPAALCNAFRYNYGDLEGCAMLLDIGAKTSNLLFFEKGKVYSRGINIGANSITQDFSNESKLRFPDAESAKIDKGFVSLGGAYAEPDDPQAAAISKIARQFMTRLHIQVNQTIQYYRSQQGGTAPQQLFLSGGASIMPYTAQFFAEKLNLPVEYFNPFRNVQIDPALDLEDLSKFAHSFGEVVGLGLRELAHCPVELNLMPKSSIQRQEFGHKKPYFVAAVFSLALVVFALGFAEEKIAGVRRDATDKIKQRLGELTPKSTALDAALKQRNELVARGRALVELQSQRVYWGKVMVELRRILLVAEEKTKKSLGGTNDAGIWVDTFSPQLPAGSPFTVTHIDSTGAPGYASAAPVRPPPGYTPAGMPGAAAGLAASDQQVVTNISVICKAVSLKKFSPEADSTMAYTVQAELKASPFFGDVSLGQMDYSGDAYTFILPLTVTLKKPLTW